MSFDFLSYKDEFHSHLKDELQKKWPETRKGPSTPVPAGLFQRVAGYLSQSRDKKPDRFLELKKEEKLHVMPHISAEKLEHLAQDVLRLQDEIHAIEYLPLSIPEKQTEMQAKKRNVAEIRELFEKAILLASTDNEGKLLDNYIKLLSPDELQSLAKKIETLTKARQAALAPQQELRDRVDRWLSLASQEVKIPGVAPRSLGPVQMPKTSALLENLLVLEKVLEDKGDEEKLLQVRHALAGLSRKYSLIGKMRFEGLKQTYRKLQEHPQSEMGDKLAQLENSLKETQDLLALLGRCLPLEKKRLQSVSSYPLEVIFSLRNPDEEAVYSELNKSWGSALLAVVTGKSGRLGDETQRFIRTEARVEKEIGLLKSLGEEAEQLERALKRAGKSSSEDYDRIREGLEKAEEAVTDLNEQSARLEKNQLDLVGEPFCHAIEELVKLREEIPQLKNAFGSMGLKAALVQVTENLHQAMEELFTEEYGAAISAEVEECKKHAEKEASVAQANLAYVKGELTRFQTRLAALQKRWQACQTKAIELQLGAQDPNWQSLENQLKKRNRAAHQVQGDKVTYQYKFSGIEKQIEQQARQIEELLKKLEGISGTESPKEPSADRTVLSPEKKRRVRKARDLAASEVGYSTFTKDLVLRGLAFMQLLDVGFKEYQKLFPQQREASVSTFTHQQKAVSTLLDCLVVSGEFQKVEEWSDQEFAQFAKHLTSGERPIFEAMRHPEILENMSQNDFKALIEASPLEGDSIHSLNRFYRGVFWPVEKHSLYGRRFEGRSPMQAQTALKTVRQAIQGSHQALETMIQTHPEILTMPEESLRGLRAQIAPDAEQVSPQPAGFQSAIQNLLPSDQALLMTLRNQAQICSLDPFPLAKLQELGLSDSTIQVVGAAWSLRDAEIKPLTAQEPVLRTPRIPIASEPAVLTLQDLRSEEVWQAAQPAAAEHIVETALPILLPFKMLIDHFFSYDAGPKEDKTLQQQEVDLKRMQKFAGFIERHEWESLSSLALELFRLKEHQGVSTGTWKERLKKLDSDLKLAKRQVVDSVNIHVTSRLQDLKRAGIAPSALFNAEKELVDMRHAWDFEVWEKRALSVQREIYAIEDGMNVKSESYLNELNQQAVASIKNRYGHLMQGPETARLTELEGKLTQQLNVSPINMGTWNEEAIQLNRQLMNFQKQMEGLHLKEIQSSQLFRFLEKSGKDDFEISLKALIHLFGDPFGKGSGGEGWSQMQSMSLLQKMVSRRIRVMEEFAEKEPASGDVAADLQQDLIPMHRLNKALQIGLEIEGHISGPFEKLQEIVKTKYASIKVGESMIVGGGWVGKRPVQAGHGMIYELIKQPNGKATVRIYNRGAGIDYHQQVIIHRGKEVEGKFLPFYEMVDASIGSFTSEAVLGKLVKMRTHEPQLDEKAWGSQDIYPQAGGAFASLDGRESSNQYGIEDLVFSQYSGICSMASLIGYFSGALPGQKLETRLNFEMGLLAIDRFVRDPSKWISDKDLASALQQRILIDASALHREGVITTDELLLATDKVKEWQAQMAHMATPTVILGETYEGAKSFKAENMFVPFPQKIATPPPEIEKKRFHTASIASLQFAEALPEFVDQCRDVASKIDTIFKTEDFESVLAELEVLAEKIPLEQVKKGSQQLDERSRKQLSDALYLLMDRYFKSKIASLTSRPEEKRQLTPEQYVTALRYLTFYAAVSPYSASIIPEEVAKFQQHKQAYFLLEDPESIVPMLEVAHPTTSIFDHWQIFTQEAVISPLLIQLIAKDNQKNMEELIKKADVIYMKEYLDKNPDIKERIWQSLSASPFRVAQDDNWSLALFALSNKVYDLQTNRAWDNPVPLPKEFAEARRAWFYASYLLKGHLEIPEMSQHPDTYAPVFVAYLKQAPGAPRENKWSLYAAAPWCRIGQSKKYTNIEVTQSHIQQPTFASYLYDDAFEIKRQGTNWIALDVYKQWKVIPEKMYREELRAWRNIFSNPEAQVRLALSYIQDHPLALTDADQAIAFSIALFGPGLLEKEFSYSPHASQEFVKEMGQWISNSLTFYRMVGDRKAETSLLEIARRLESRIHNLQHKSPALFPQPFVLLFSDIQKEIEISLKNEKMDRDSRLFLHMQMVLSIRDRARLRGSITLAEAKELIVHASHFGSRFQKLEMKEYQVTWKNEVHKAIQFLKDDLKSILIEHPYILSESVQNLTGRQVGPFQAAPEFPHFAAVSHQDSYSIDVLTGELRVNKRKLEELPPHIKTDDNFIAFFGKDQPVLCRCLSDNHYQLSSQGETYELIWRDTALFANQKGLVIRRTLGDEVLEYVRKSDFQEVNHAVQEGTTAWASSSGEIYLLSEDGTPRYTLVSTNAFRWPEDSSQKLLSFEIWKTEAQLVDGKVKKTAYRLQNAREDRQVGHILSAFEDPAEMMIWKDTQANRIYQIELPKHQLTFVPKHIRGTEVFSCEQIPGYAIAKAQPEEHFHALLLEKEDNPQESLMLIPRQKFEKKDQWQKLETKPDYPARREYFRFRKDAATHKLLPDGSDSLHSKEEASLYLAFQHLWQHDYPAALQLLRQLNPTHALNPKEREILRWIVDSAQLSKDETPYAYEVGLYAAFILSRNGQEAKGLHEAFSHYLSHRSRQTLNPLTPSEEMAIYLTLAKSDKMMEERMALLKKLGQLPDVAILTKKMVPGSTAVVTPTVDVPPEKLPEQFCLLLEKRIDRLENALVPPQVLREIVAIQETRETAKQVREAIQRLKQLYVAPQKSGVIDQIQLLQQQQALEAYFTMVQEDLHDLKAGKPAALKQLLETTRQNMGATEAELRALEKQIVAMGNKAPVTVDEMARREADLRSGQFKVQTLDDLIELFRRRDTEAFTLHNPAITVDEAIELENRIYQYLLKATENQAARRLATSGTALLKLMEEPHTAPLAMQAALIQFQADALTKRAYPVAEFPDRLVYEYFMNILIKPSQCRDLDLLASEEGGLASLKTGYILERIMGYGKTFVVLPNLLRQIAEAGDLAAGVIPPLLFESQVQEASGYMQHALRQESDRLNVDAFTQLDTKTLKLVLHQMSSAIQNKKALWVTPENIFSLFLKSVDLVTKWSQSQFWGWENIDLVREIVRLQHDYLHLIVDEATVNLAVKRLYLLPVGHTAPLKQEIIDSLMLMMEVIETDPEIARLSDLPFLQTKVGGIERKEEHAAFTPAIYHQKIKAPLIDKVIQKLVASEDPEVAAYFSHVAENPQERAQVQTYLIGEEQGEAFWQGLKNPKTQAVLNHLRAVFVQVLPSVLEKKLFIDYGALSKEDYEAIPEELRKLVDPDVAIPWRGANAPDVGSRYHLSLAEALYTFMHHRSQGVSLDTVKKEIDKLRAQVQQDLKTHPNTPMQEIPAYDAFKYLCGENKLQLFALTSEDYQRIQTTINSERKLLYKFIQTYIMPKIEVNSKVVTAGPQLLGILPKRTQGFTGTLASSEIFPGNTLAQPDPISFAETRLALERQKPPVAVLPISSFHVLPTVAAKLDALYSGREDPFESIIDLAGIFTGIKDNREVAEAMLTHPRWKEKVPPILGVSYYDRQGKLKIVMKGSDNKLESKDFDPDHPPCARESILSFWDQLRTTGSNIKHHPKARAIITLDADTASKEHDQAAWRLREIHKLQRIEYAIAQKSAGIVLEKLSILTRPLDYRDVLRYIELNQAKVRAEQSIEAYKQKVAAVQQRLCVEALRSKTLLGIDLKKVWSDLAQPFYEETLKGDYQYFPLAREVPSEKFLSDLHKKTTLRLQELQKNRILARHLDFGAAQAELDATYADFKSKVPEQILAGQELSATVQLSQTQTTQTQQTTTTQTQTQTQQTLIPSYTESIPRVALNLGQKLFSAATYLPQLKRYARNEFDVHKEYMELKKSHATPFLTVKEGLKESPHQALAALHRAIAPELKATINFMPFMEKIKWEHAYTPYDISQHNFEDALIEIDKQSKKIQMTLLTIDDSIELKNLLQSSKEKKEGEVSLAIMHKHGALSATSSDLDPAMLQNHPKVTMLRAQAKFLNGDIAYSPAEMEALKQWLHENPAMDFKSIFENHLLTRRDRNQVEYPNSELQKLLAQNQIVEKAA